MDGWADVGALDIICVLGGSDAARVLGVVGYCPIIAPIVVCLRFRFARVEGLVVAVSIGLLVAEAASLLLLMPLEFGLITLC